MKRNILASAALLSAMTMAAAFTATPAHAGLEIQLQSGKFTYTKTGSSPLVVVDNIGTFGVTVNTGTTTAAPSLDLSSVDITTSGAGTLVITLSANGLTAASAVSWLSQFSGLIVTGAATVTLATYFDADNQLMGTHTLLSTLTSSSTPFSLSSLTAGVADSMPFTLTEVITIVASCATEVSLDGSVTAAPEPASMTLLGSAMIGIGALARRKRTV